jgi:hypothetical protein
MDKEQYVVALRSGVEEFVKLREQDKASDRNRDLDLSGVDLSGCNLQDAPLAGINFEGANLEGVDLTGANLRFANLKGARFRGAKLVGVNMHQVHLKGADLRGAILGAFDANGLICLNTWMFRGVRWDKEHLEYLLDVLNQNDDWEIKYEVVPRAK